MHDIKIDDIIFKKMSLLNIINFYLAASKNKSQNIKLHIIDLLFNDPNLTYDDILSRLKNDGHKVTRNHISEIKKVLEIPNILEFSSRNYFISNEIRDYYRNLISRESY